MGTTIYDDDCWMRYPTFEGPCQIVTCSCTTCFCSPQALSHLSSIGTTIQTCAQPPQRQKNPTPAQEVQHLSQQLSWATLRFYNIMQIQPCIFIVVHTHLNSPYPFENVIYSISQLYMCYTRVVSVTYSSHRIGLRENLQHTLPIGGKTMVSCRLTVDFPINQSIERL